MSAPQLWAATPRRGAVVLLRMEPRSAAVGIGVGAGAVEHSSDVAQVDTTCRPRLATIQAPGLHLTSGPAPLPHVDARTVTAIIVACSELIVICSTAAGGAAMSVGKSEQPYEPLRVSGSKTVRASAPRNTSSQVKRSEPSETVRDGPRGSHCGCSLSCSCFRAGHGPGCRRRRSTQAPRVEHRRPPDLARLQAAPSRAGITAVSPR